MAPPDGSRGGSGVVVLCPGLAPNFNSGAGHGTGSADPDQIINMYSLADWGTRLTYTLDPNLVARRDLAMV